MTTRRVLVLATTIVAALLAACDPAAPEVSAREPRTLPYFDSPDFTPRWDVVAAADPEFHRIQPFELVHQRGAPFTEQDLDGKIVVADFFFTTCPSVCPRMVKSMYALQEEFRSSDHVLLVSHSVTPKTDTVEVLQAYAAKHEIDFDRWKLLTGDRDEIYDLGRASYFVEEDLGTTKAPTDFLHTENFVLLDGRRRLRGIYNSLDPSSMKTLVEDIRTLELETPAAVGRR